MAVMKCSWPFLDVSPRVCVQGWMFLSLLHLLSECEVVNSHLGEKKLRIKPLGIRRVEIPVALEN